MSVKMRKCAICKVEKSATDEHFGKEGQHSYCRPCERTRNWIERKYGKADRQEWEALLVIPGRR